MSKQLPLLARQLKARREALGITQEEMAATLGVDKTTLWRWESGQTRPKSKEILERLKRAYGASQEELNAWFAGLALEQDTSESAYAMRGYDLLVEQGMDLHDLLDQLIEIDAQILPHLRSSEIGTAEQWMSVFQESPSTWRLLTCRGEIIGYWHYLCLTRDAFDLAKEGRLRDGEITPAMVEFPLPLDSGITYLMYIAMFGISPQHERPMADMILMRDFLKEVRAAAELGVFFSEICAVAFSSKSAFLCRQIGMQSIGQYQYRREDEIGEVFFLEGAQVPETRLAAGNRRLAELYRKRFLFHSKN